VRHPPAKTLRSMVLYQSATGRPRPASDVTVPHPSSVSCSMGGRPRSPGCCHVFSFLFGHDFTGCRKRRYQAVFSPRSGRQMVAPRRKPGVKDAEHRRSPRSGRKKGARKAFPFQRPPFFRNLFSRAEKGLKWAGVSTPADVRFRVSLQYHVPTFPLRDRGPRL